MKLIRFYAILFLLFVTNSCTSTIPLEDNSWKTATISHSIPVRGDGFKLSKETRKKLAIEIDRFPSAHKNVLIVYVSKHLKNDIVGLYYHKIIHILYDNTPYMKRILWHELAHAMVRSMSNEHLYEWCEAFDKRLEKIGLEHSMGKKWCKIKNYDGFPTRYSTKNVNEFIAEHVMKFTSNRKQHAYLYPLEHNLIIKHKLYPIR